MCLSSGVAAISPIILRRPCDARVQLCTSAQHPPLHLPSLSRPLALLIPGARNHPPSPTSPHIRPLSSAASRVLEASPVSLSFHKISPPSTTSGRAITGCWGVAPYRHRATSVAPDLQSLATEKRICLRPRTERLTCRVPSAAVPSRTHVAAFRAYPRLNHGTAYQRLGVLPRSTFGAQTALFRAGRSSYSIARPPRRADPDFLEIILCAITTRFDIVASLLMTASSFW